MSLEIQKLFDCIQFVLLVGGTNFFKRLSLEHVSFINDERFVTIGYWWLAASVWTSPIISDLLTNKSFRHPNFLIWLETLDFDNLSHGNFSKEAFSFMSTLMWVHIFERISSAFHSFLVAICWSNSILVLWEITWSWYIFMKFLWLNLCKLWVTNIKVPWLLDGSFLSFICLKTILRLDAFFLSVAFVIHLNKIICLL